MRARELFAVGEQAAFVQIPKIQQLLARLDPALFRLGPVMSPTVSETVPEMIQHSKGLPPVRAQPAAMRKVKICLINARKRKLQSWRESGRRVKRA
jgi:hypothetical protein